MSAPPLEAVRCNLCGEDDFSVLHHSPWPGGEREPADFAASTDRFDRYGRVVRCRRCALAYTNPRPRAAQVLQGYEKTVDPDYAEEDSSRSINGHLSLSTIKRFVKEGALLDVGCSTGYFLNAARLDFDVQGLEPSHWAAAYAKERLRLDVREGALAADSFPQETFEVVTMIDVIEHFADPAGALRDARGLLKPGGLLYLVTPDIASFSARILRGKWWGLRPAHLYYFSVETMSKMLGGAGFDVVLVKSYGRIFSYRYWLSRLASYPWLMRAPVAGAVRLLGMEDKFLYLNTRDSMEVCARKR